MFSMRERKRPRGIPQCFCSGYLESCAPLSHPPLHRYHRKKRNSHETSDQAPWPSIGWESESMVHKMFERELTSGRKFL
jgi:hypothetical protein